MVENRLRKHGAWLCKSSKAIVRPGLSDKLLSKMAKCGKKKVDSHACRNLDQCIKQHGRRLPVRVSYVETMVRRSKRRKQEEPFQYPVLKLSDWADAIFSNGGHYFLGGRDLDHSDEIGQELFQFWARYKVMEPDFEYFRESSPEDWHYAIPLALHGDEGRGKAGRAVMVMSVQTLLPITPGKTNMCGRHGP